MEAKLKIFKQHRIDPLIDGEENIPDLPGNYIICLKKQANLPKTKIQPTLKKFEGHEVIYTGLASKSLRKRDFRQHFKGNNSGSSTLRKSIGSLMGLKKIPRDKNEDSTKTKFNITDEEKLTKWMNKNLILFVCPTNEFIETEQILINKFNPPLNLKDNKNDINADYRKNLSSLRSYSANTNIIKSDKKIKQDSTDVNTPTIVENASFGHLLIAVSGLSAIGLCILAIIIILGLMIYSMFL